MEKDLRPCIVNIPEVTERYRTAKSAEFQTRVIKEAETHKGYFHTWGSEAYVTNGYLAGTTAGQVSTLYGVVEYEDGTIHKVEPEYITFTERRKVNIDIDSDIIAKAVVEMMKD